MAQGPLWGCGGKELQKNFKIFSQKKRIENFDFFFRIEKVKTIMIDLNFVLKVLKWPV